MSSVVIALIERNIDEIYRGIDFSQKDVVDVVMNNV
jgi:hypothetical protein